MKIKAKEPEGQNYRYQGSKWYNKDLATSLGAYVLTSWSLSCIVSSLDSAENTMKRKYQRNEEWTFWRVVIIISRWGGSMLPLNTTPWTSLSASLALWATRLTITWLHTAVCERKLSAFTSFFLKNNNLFVCPMRSLKSWYFPRKKQPKMQIFANKSNLWKCILCLCSISVSLLI